MWWEFLEVWGLSWFWCGGLGFDEGIVGRGIVGIGLVMVFVEMFRSFGLWEWREMRMGREIVVGLWKVIDVFEFELYFEGSGELLKNVK